jgi:hypothetical protein
MENKILTSEQLEDGLMKIHLFMDEEFDEPDHERDVDNSNGCKCQYFIAPTEENEDGELFDIPDQVVSLTVHLNGKVEIEEENFKYLEDELTALVNDPNSKYQDQIEEMDAKY